MNTPKAQIEGGGGKGDWPGGPHTTKERPLDRVPLLEGVCTCVGRTGRGGVRHTQPGDVTQAITYEILAASDTRVINTGKDCRRGEAARSLAAEGSRM